jgi:hypothetical protein
MHGTKKAGDISAHLLPVINQLKKSCSNLLLLAGGLFPTRSTLAKHH